MSIPPLPGCLDLVGPELGLKLGEQPYAVRLELGVTHLVGPDCRADRLAEEVSAPLLGVARIATVAIKERSF